MKLLNEILGTKYPIIQGGMANIATGEFAAACSNAGALGLIGSGGMDADALRENIRHCRALTDQPFGVNIMLMHPQADEFAKIVVEEGVKIVTTGAGNPGKYMAMWKAAGITVIPVVAAAILAKHLEPLGIDAVIAEGTESGGHVGEMTTMALVPQVVDAVHVPVIAAGGIADGRGLAAALALGACGVQVGTCLLASTECPIHENYKAALLKARDSDTIRRYSGRRACRGLLAGQCGYRLRGACRAGGPGDDGQDSRREGSGCGGGCPGVRRDRHHRVARAALRSGRERPHPVPVGALAVC